MFLPLQRVYFDATRPKMAFFAVLLFLASASHLNIALWRWESAAICAFLTFAVSAIVLTNDVVDRAHDLGKGRTLASERTAGVVAWAIALWGAAAVAAAPLGWWYPALAPWLVWLCACGLGYSWLRAVPLLSGVAVSASYATIPLLAALAAPSAPTWPDHHAWTLAVAIGAYVHGRETIADVEDVAIDRGYKKTIPVLFGVEAARYAMSTLYTIGLLAALHATPLALLMLPLYIRTQALTFAPQLDADALYRVVDLQTLGFVALLLLS